jgi:hypothetical protein
MTRLAVEQLEGRFARPAVSWTGNANTLKRRGHRQSPGFGFGLSAYLALRLQGLGWLQHTPSSFGPSGVRLKLGGKLAEVG